MICKHCHREIENPSPKQLFCKDSCRNAHYNTKHKFQRRKTANKRWERIRATWTFPLWRCPNGHEIQLDFYPMKDYDKLKKLECPICKQKTA